MAFEVIDCSDMNIAHFMTSLVIKKRPNWFLLLESAYINKIIIIVQICVAYSHDK